jgi:hypothetical protein
MEFSSQTFDGTRDLSRVDRFNIFWAKKRAAKNTAAPLFVERNEFVKKGLWV